MKTAVGKTPFIGVLFDEEVTAASMNANWPNHYPNDLYTITLDAGARLRMIVKSQVNPGISYELKYDPVELLKFMAKTKDCKLYKFGHLFRNKGNFQLVSTSIKSRPWVLKVDCIKILVEY